MEVNVLLEERSKTCKQVCIKILFKQSGNQCAERADDIVNLDSLVNCIDIDCHPAFESEDGVVLDVVEAALILCIYNFSDVDVGSAGKVKLRIAEVDADFVLEYAVFLDYFFFAEGIEVDVDVRVNTGELVVIDICLEVESHAAECADLLEVNTEHSVDQVEDIFWNKALNKWQN